MLPHLSPQSWSVVDDYFDESCIEKSPKTVEDIRTMLSRNGSANGVEKDGFDDVEQARDPKQKTMLKVRAGETVYVLSKK